MPVKALPLRGNWPAAIVYAAANHVEANHISAQLSQRHAGRGRRNKGTALNDALDSPNPRAAVAALVAAATDDDQAAARRKSLDELALLKMTELYSRVLAAGVDVDAVDEAMESKLRKTTPSMPSTIYWWKPSGETSLFQRGS